MSERSRKKARQAKRAEARANVQTPIHTKTAPPASMRSTFKVAQANRVIAAELPTVIRQRSRDKRASSIRLDRSPVQAATMVNQPSDPKKTVSQGRQREQLTMDRQAIDEPGKCRPKDNTPKGSGASSRDFHLWKKTC